VRNLLLTICATCLLASAYGCSTPPRPAGNVVFLIESNPANLDPRYATDGTTQRIDRLIFNGLVVRDNEMKLHGDLAESWETPDPLTYIFHLKPGIHFHDGRPLTSRDVKFTIEFMMDPANRSPKRGSFNMISSIEAPDATTVIFHLKETYASFLWNMERSAVGIVPAGSGREFSEHPVGTGAFQFVSQAQDDSVVLTANDDAVQNVTFRIVPDAIVRALELRKGSADVEMSSLSPDMIPVLAKRKELQVTEEPGTNFAYLGVNLEDPILKKKEVRQALAYAIDRDSLIKYLLRGQARKASGILPPNHWAYDPDVRKYAYDPTHAEQLLDDAGFPRDANGVRMRLTLKVSTQEQARLVAAALQDQWKRVGIALEVRPLELATLFSDLDKGNFQLSYSIWVGANNDPDIFDLVFSSNKIPPNGRNRGRYRNSQADALIEQIRGEMDQSRRKELCGQIQKILSEDLPYVPLWYVDQVSVHSRHLQVQLTPTGDFDFLTTTNQNLRSRK
jgi:peptide/nickel transport system substrate-binding protein